MTVSFTIFLSMFFSAVTKSLGYVDTELHMESPVRPTQIPQQLNFPGSQVLIGMEWFVNFKAKYKATIESDQ